MIIIKRDGSTVAFDANKIVTAINKAFIEQKTTVVRNVYRTRRPVNLTNNEDKKDEKKGEDDKKEDAVPKRYHRRYRENKMSTNIEH